MHFWKSRATMHAADRPAVMHERIGGCRAAVH